MYIMSTRRCETNGWWGAAPMLEHAWIAPPRVVHTLVDECLVCWRHTHDARTARVVAACSEARRPGRRQKLPSTTRAPRLPYAARIRSGAGAGPRRGVPRGAGGPEAVRAHSGRVPPGSAVGTRVGRRGHHSG